MTRPGALLILLLLALSESGAQQRTPESGDVATSGGSLVVMVIDHSLSMAGRYRGSSRLDAAQRTARHLGQQLSRAGRRWAVITAGDGVVRVARAPAAWPVAAAASAVPHELSAAGLSPLFRALQQASDVAAEHALSAAIVVLSDGLETERIGALGRAPAKLWMRGDTLLAVTFPLPDNRPATGMLPRLAAATGGAVFRPEQSAALTERVLALTSALSQNGAAASSPMLPEAAVPFEAADDSESTDADESKGASAASHALLPAPAPALAVRRGALLAYLVAMVVLGWLVTRRVLRRARRNRVARVAAAPVPTINVSVRSPAPATGRGRLEERSFTQFPVQVSARPEAHLRLAQSHGSGTRVRAFVLEPTESGVLFRSRGGHIINGVSTKRRVLREGDLIVAGRHRITFHGHRLRFPEPQLESLRIGPELAGAGTLAAAALLAVVLVGGARLRTPTPAGGHLALADDAAASTAQRIAAAAVADAALVASPAGSLATRTRTGQRRPAPPALLPAVLPGDLLGVTPPVVVRWPAVATLSPVDLLAIHAHPDDETLDFGALLAAATSAGLSTAVVLFTDGESGVDRFPARGTDGAYPAYPLRGTELAQRRVIETTNALDVLGAGHYVRLGLANRPYSSISQLVAADRVVAEWGGERVIAEVSELIRAFAPQLVVAPDRSSGAREHFEHEATGIVVQQAMQRLQQAGEALPALFVSVDPWQRGAYIEVQSIDAMATDRRTGLTLREVQLYALQQHRSQYDAAVAGMESVLQFAREYYVAVRPGPLGTLEAYVAP